MDFNSLVTPFLWMIIKFLLVIGVIILAIAFFVIGPLTYGRPLKKSRKEPDGVEVILELGIVLSHLMIDKLLGKRRINRNEWQNDRQLIAHLRGMNPSEFEEFTAELFQKLGYKTEAVGGKSDGGIDVIATKDGVRHYIQCKKYITSKVSVGEMRDFYGAMADFMAGGKGFFITTNIFTHEAEQFAEDKPIELIDQFKLIQMIRSVEMPVEATPKTFSPTSGGTCPRCGKALVARKSKYGEFIGCTGFPKCRYIKKD